MTSPVPRAPAIDLEKVLATYTKLADRAAYWNGAPLEGDQLLGLCRALAAAANCPKRVDTIREAVRPWWGKRIGADYPAVAARVAGNLHRISRGEAPADWGPASPPEWMFGQIVDARNCRHRFRPRDEPDTAVRLQVRVLAGTLTPRVFPIFWSPKMTAYSARHFGFRRRRAGPAFFYSDPFQLFGLRARFLLAPSPYPDDPHPKVSRVHCPAGLLAYNRRLLVDRSRPADGFACPFAFSHPCHRCVMGLGECPVATHADKFTLAPCPRCGQPAAPFDPKAAGDVCVRCNQRQEL